MKKSKLLRISVAVLAVVIIVGFIFSAFITRSYTARVQRTVKGMAVAPGTSARAMATLEMTSGRVLYSKNADVRLPMASTTKIFTALTVIENCPNLDVKVKVSNKAIGIEGTSIYLQRDEELTVRELLLGLMLRSGNDAAVALALHVSPTVEDFCKKMKETAERCGAISSNFKNPHGLDEEGHYTTAFDLALVSCHAMREPKFAEIVGTRQAKISGVEYPRVLHNKNRLLASFDGCNGVKTGFTKKAGRCYVGSREADGMTVICAVLNCGPMFEEAEELMKAGGEEYKITKLLEKDKMIKDSELSKWGIGLADFYYPLKDSEADKIVISLEDKLRIKFGTELLFETEYVKLNL